MKKDVQVAIVGGGIVGVAVLYWLAKKGWTDIILVERRELTSGSTWHAAGNTTYFGPYPQMIRLFAGSIRTYLQAQKESGQSIDFHQTGSLRLAASQRELELFHVYKSRYAQIGIPFYIRTPEEVSQLHPFVDTSQVFGAAHTPTDGHVDPAGATNAMANAARSYGASIERYWPVDSIQQSGNGWRLESRKGTITAHHVVIATSFWAHDMLAEIGLDLPVYATQHHEIVTDTIPGIKGREVELPAIRDSYVSCNVRQERDGLLIGIYESEPEFWALEGIPQDFAEELLPPNLDRLMPHIERLIERMPVLSEAGIKTVNNGPMCFTPDGLPLLGPIPGKRGLWLATGFNVGIGTGGGAAEILADWMTTCEAPTGLDAVHAGRFGNGMPTHEALNSIREVYSRGYHLPDQI